MPGAKVDVIKKVSF